MANPICDSKIFELLCRDLWRNNPNYESVQINGRPGQQQDGVDIFARCISNRKWIGIQCKVRDGKLTIDEIKEEILKALEFNPKLSKYYIYTTAKRDASLQESVRVYSENALEELTKHIEVKFWDDIEEQLKEEINFNIYHCYYHSFIANNETLGHGIGRLINLELGTFPNSADTHYELMIGKVPPSSDQDDYFKVNYYKGSYFIINYHERRMETFPIPCYASDLEQCFLNKFDRQRVSNWINSIENIDDFIYGTDDINHTFISNMDKEDYYNEDE